MAGRTQIANEFEKIGSRGHVGHIVIANLLEHFDSDLEVASRGKGDGWKGAMAIAIFCRRRSEVAACGLG